MIRARRRRLTGPPGEEKDPMRMIFLSLFLMLLSFFIVLNSHMDFEDQRQEEVRNSIERAFSTHVLREDMLPSLAADPYESIREGDTTERLEALFRSQIASFRPTRNKQTGQFMVEMPLEEFAGAVLALGQADLTALSAAPAMGVSEQGKYFLPTLVSILKSDRAGIAYRMDIFIQSRQNPAALVNADPRMMESLMQRGASWVRHLQENGMPEYLLSYGVIQGRNAQVMLQFRPHTPYAPVEEEGGP